MTDFTILLLGYLGAGFFFGSAAYMRSFRTCKEDERLPAFLGMAIGYPIISIIWVFAVIINNPLVRWLSWLERMARK